MTRALGVAAALVVGSAGAAAADSALRLPLPRIFGRTPAATFDADGERIGDAQLSLERLDADRVRIRSETSVDGGARTIASALLRVVDGGSALVIVRQESRSIAADGSSLGTLLVDHEAGVAVCDGTDEQGSQRRELPIPTPDRVVNVPFNLLFDALVKNTSRELKFDLLLCRPKPRFMAFSAKVDRVLSGRGSHETLVEVTYRPDVGFLSFVVNRLVPRLSFWFDPAAPNPWVAHRMPLYAMGPEVVILHHGTSYTDLDAD